MGRIKATWLNLGPRVTLVPPAVVVGSVAMAVAACSGGTGTGTGGAGSCSNDYSGRWGLSGSCSTAKCDVVQSSACGATVTCTDGAKLSGSVSGTTASVSGTARDGSAISCSVTFGNTKSFTISCSGTNLCSGTGTCESGACGTPISGSSGTTSGSTSGSTSSSGATGGTSGGSSSGGE